jgi:hypothetical protein
MGDLSKAGTDDESAWAKAKKDENKMAAVKKILGIKRVQAQK